MAALLRTLTAFRSTRWYREFQRSRIQQKPLLAGLSSDGSNLTEQIPGVLPGMKKLVYATLQALVKEGFDAAVVEALLDPDSGELRVYVDDSVREDISSVESVLRRFGAVERTAVPDDDPSLGTFTLALRFGEDAKGKSEELPDLDDEEPEEEDGAKDTKAPAGDKTMPVKATGNGDVSTDIDAQRGGGVVQALGKQDGTLQVRFADSKKTKTERRKIAEDAPAGTPVDDFDFAEPGEDANAPVEAVSDEIPVVAVDGVEVVSAVERRRAPKREGAGVAAYADDPKDLAYSPETMEKGDKDGVEKKSKDEEDKDGGTESGKDDEKDEDDVPGQDDAEQEPGQDDVGADAPEKTKPGPDIDAALSAAAKGKAEAEPGPEETPGDPVEPGAEVVSDGGDVEGTDWLAVANALVVLSKAGVLDQIAGSPGGAPGQDVPDPSGLDGQDDVDHDNDGDDGSEFAADDDDDADEFGSDDDEEEDDEVGDAEKKVVVDDKEDDAEKDDEFEAEEDPEATKAPEQTAGGDVPMKEPVEQEATSDPPVVAGLRQIVADKQAGKVGGQAVDLFSAGVALAVYDAAGDEWKAKLAKLPAQQLVALAYKATKKVGPESLCRDIERAEKIMRESRRRAAPTKPGTWARTRSGMPAVRIVLGEGRKIVESKIAEGGLKAARVVLLGIDKKAEVATFAARPNFESVVYNATLADWRRFAEAEDADAKDKKDDEKKDEPEKKKDEAGADNFGDKKAAPFGKDGKKKDDADDEKEESFTTKPFPLGYAPCYGQRVMLKAETYGWKAGVYDVVDNSFVQGFLRVRPVDRGSFQVPREGIPLPIHAFEGLVEAAEADEKKDKKDEAHKDDCSCPICANKKESRDDSVRGTVRRLVENMPRRRNLREEDNPTAPLAEKPSLADVNARITNASLPAIGQADLDKVWELATGGSPTDAIFTLTGLPKQSINYALNRQGAEG